VNCRARQKLNFSKESHEKFNFSEEVELLMAKHPTLDIRTEFTRKIKPAPLDA
jgi:hypothetical protein